MTVSDTWRKFQTPLSGVEICKKENWKILKRIKWNVNVTIK